LHRRAHQQRSGNRHRTEKYQPVELCSLHHISLASELNYVVVPLDQTSRKAINLSLIIGAVTLSVE
jgi:hypothetical protein